METIRLHVQDSFYALLVTYLKVGSRDIESSFNTLWTEADRVCLVDGISFGIVKRLPGEPHEIPGVNLMLYDEIPQRLRANNQGYTRLATIHVYIQTTVNVSADDRTLLKLQRSIDEALYPRGIPVVDFYGIPQGPVGRSSVHWELLNHKESWRELSDLANMPYLHRSKNVNLCYDDVAII